MHPNAEIGFRTASSEALLDTVLEISADLLASVASGGGDDEDGGGNSQNTAEAMLQDVLEMFRESVFDIEGIIAGIDDIGPFQNVFLLEIGAMNALLVEMIRSLSELELGFRGELTMSPVMEAIQDALIADKIPVAWGKLAHCLHS